MLWEIFFVNEGSHVSIKTVSEWFIIYLKQLNRFLGGHLWNNGKCGSGNSFRDPDWLCKGTAYWRIQTQLYNKDVFCCIP